MNISQATDEQILGSLQEILEASSDHRSISFTVGEKTFFFIIEFSESDTGGSLLTDYNGVNLRMYYWQPTPPSENLQMEPIVFETPEKTYRFEFNVQCFPHTPIDPWRDDLFKNQPWLKEFKPNGNIGYIRSETETSWSSLCDIIRYCDKMAKLKAFW